MSTDFLSQDEVDALLRGVSGEAEETEAEGHVLVSLAEPGFTCKVTAGPHRLIADEPKHVGGLDMGPAPYDFVGIGLGADEDHHGRPAAGSSTSSRPSRDRPRHG